MISAICINLKILLVKNKNKNLIRFFFYFHLLQNIIMSNPNMQNLDNFQEGNNTKMEGDDSHLVDEILNELNDGVQVDDNVMNAPNNIDADLHMNQDNMIHANDIPMVNTIPEEQNIMYDEEESNFSSIFNRIKKPLLVAILAFIVFNPLVFNLLSNNIPKVFGVTDNVFLKQGRTLIIAIVLGLLYFGTSLLI
tara:strand:- start:350 stop:931 length:582 start_codon:yes stop_codon:yes gene_type:complete